MPFNPKGKAQIQNIAIKRGTADDATVSLYIDFKMEDMPATVVASALGAEDPADVVRSLFRPISQDAEQNSKFMGLHSINCSAIWEDKHAIKIHGLCPVRVHKVNKVVVVPRGFAKFDGRFSVTIQQPPQGFVENLAEHLNTELDIDLEHDAELFDKETTELGSLTGPDVSISFNSRRKKSN